MLLDEEWFETAAVLNPSSEKERISIRLDKDVLRFFREGGRGYQSRINKVLRAFVTSKCLRAARSKTDPTKQPSSEDE